MASVLLIGRNSFLGRAFLAAATGVHRVDAVGHDIDLDSLELAAYDAVVNMAYDPRYMSEPYGAGRDVDLAVAEAVSRVGPRRPHLFLMSTRRVYGRAAAMPVDETAAADPADVYSSNKLVTEAAATRLLGDGLTILRLPNVFGLEPGRHTFFGIALAKLKAEGRIVLDTSPFTTRDFLPVEHFAAALVRTVTAAPPGLFNLGSGRGTPLGRIALWIIEGYGAGELVITSPREWDSFQLDSRKLAAVIGGYTDGIDIRSSCINIGQRLRHA